MIERATYLGPNNFGERPIITELQNNWQRYEFQSPEEARLYGFMATIEACRNGHDHKTHTPELLFGVYPLSGFRERGDSKIAQGIERGLQDVREGRGHPISDLLSQLSRPKS